MDLSQELMLYFIIIPLFSFLIYVIIKSYIEDKKAIKMEINELRKANRVQRELIEKEIYLRGNF